LAARCAVDLVEAAEKQYQAGVLTNTVSIPVRGTVELIKLVGRRTGLSPWLVGGVLVGGIAFLLKEPERREAAAQYVMPIVQAPLKRMEATQRRSSTVFEGCAE